MNQRPMPTSTSPPGRTAAAVSPRTRDIQVTRVVMPPITIVCAAVRRTPRIPQPMASITVSKLQAAAKTSAARKVPSICFPPFRPSYAQGGTEVNRRKKGELSTSWTVPRWFFQSFPAKRRASSTARSTAFRMF